MTVTTLSVAVTGFAVVAAIVSSPPSRTTREPCVRRVQRCARRERRRIDEQQRFCPAKCGYQPCFAQLFPEPAPAATEAFSWHSQPLPTYQRRRTHTATGRLNQSGCASAAAVQHLSSVEHIRYIQGPFSSTLSTG